MLLVRSLLLCALVSLCVSRQGWENIHPAATCEEQTRALQGLLARNIPHDFLPYFVLSVVDTCQEDTALTYVKIVSRQVEEGRREIVITGSDGVSTAFGLNYYLKYHTMSQITWTEHRLALNHPLPQADLSIRSLDKFRLGLALPL